MNKDILPTIIDNDFLEELSRMNNKVISGNYDSLVLSCTLFRLKTNNILHDVDGLDSENLPKYITTADIKLAESIASYYKEKLILLRLKNANLSNFKKDLGNYLVSDRMGFNNNTLGMIYRLPEFYHYDVAMDKMISEHFPDIHENKSTINKKDNVIIKPLCKLQKNSSRGEQNIYWFKELDLNLPLFINIERKNKLLNIWDNVFNSNAKLELYGKLSTLDFNNHKYIELTHWNINSNFLIFQKD